MLQYLESFNSLYTFFSAGKKETHSFEKHICADPDFMRSAKYKEFKALYATLKTEGVSFFVHNNAYTECYALVIPDKGILYGYYGYIEDETDIARLQLALCTNDDINDLVDSINLHITDVNKTKKKFANRAQQQPNNNGWNNYKPS